MRTVSWSQLLTLLYCLRDTYCHASGLDSNNSELNINLYPEAGDDYLGTWEAPNHLLKMFPYYVSGYDLDRRPMELGKWPIRSVIEKGGEDYENFRKHVKQFMYRFEKGPELLIPNVDDRGADGSACITDFEDFSITQLMHKQTLQFCMNYFASFQRIQHSSAYEFFINVNSVAQMLVDASRPLMGSSMERTEIYGTKKDKWMPKLLQKIDSSQLPPQYGGEPTLNFKPVTTFGNLVMSRDSALGKD